MGHYRVRVKKGDIEVEVDSSDKDYTESKLKELLAHLEVERKAPPRTHGAAGLRSGTPRTKPLSMAEHVRSLSPKSGAQYVVAVGDYLEKYGDMPQGFKARDIADGFKTVRYKHSNPGVAIRQAQEQGLVMDGKQADTLVVTSTGEGWVKAQLGTE